MKTKRNSRTKKMNVCRSEYFKLLAEHLKPAQVANLMYFLKALDSKTAEKIIIHLLQFYVIGGNEFLYQKPDPELEVLIRAADLIIENSYSYGYEENITATA